MANNHDPFSRPINPPPQPPANNSGKWMLGGLIVVIAIIIGLAMVNRDSGSNKGPVQGSVEELPPNAATKTVEARELPNCDTITEAEKKGADGAIQCEFKRIAQPTPQPPAAPQPTPTISTIPPAPANVGPSPGAGIGSATGSGAGTGTGSGNGSVYNGTGQLGSCTFPVPGDINKMPKGVIEDVGTNNKATPHVELVKYDEWYHRVHIPGEFIPPLWRGSDSWLMTTALGPHKGGMWIDHGNPGEIVYVGDNMTPKNARYQWCIGFLTTSKAVIDGKELDLKSQFMTGGKRPVKAADVPSMPIAINVSIAVNEYVTIISPTHPVNCPSASDITRFRNCQQLSANSVKAQVSDQGDLTITMPDHGRVYLLADYVTEQPSHEAEIWWGPYNKCFHINTVGVGGVPACAGNPGPGGFVTPAK